MDLPATLRNRAALARAARGKKLPKIFARGAGTWLFPTTSAGARHTHCQHRHAHHLHASGHKAERDRARAARDFLLAVQEAALARARAGSRAAVWDSLVDRIAEGGAGKVLVLGAIDGRNTKLETRETLFPVLDRVLPRLAPPVALSPSCGLELLPRARARAKLETMARLAREYAGRGGETR